MKPIASVVVISDYKVGCPLAWDDLRATLCGLGLQDFPEPVEIIFLESLKHKDHIPTDLSEILPGLEIVFSGQELQYALKNEAARVAHTDIVILLDADCVPEPDWLRRMVDMMRLESQPAVVSGRTVYEGRSLIQRCAALIDRSYVDRYRSARTKTISNNNAAFRRSILLAHPLPLNAGPFASRMHAEAIMRAGGRLLFERRARVRHSYYGWEGERDVRRHKGYARIATRRLDSNMPFARLGRLGYLSLPLIFGGSLLQSWWKSLVFYREYGIRWYELPVLVFYALVIHALEIPG
ncbi:MAG: glycosyltransferase, partial [Candidatus Binatia bacterium]